MIQKNNHREGSITFTSKISSVRTIWIRQLFNKSWSRSTSQKFRAILNSARWEERWTDKRRSKPNHVDTWSRRNRRRCIYTLAAPSPARPKILSRRKTAFPSGRDTRFEHRPKTPPLLLLVHPLPSLDDNDFLSLYPARLPLNRIDRCITRRQCKRRAASPISLPPRENKLLDE